MDNCRPALKKLPEWADAKLLQTTTHLTHCLILCCYSKICGTSKLIFKKRLIWLSVVERENARTCHQHFLGIWCKPNCSISVRCRVSHGKTCRWTRLGLVRSHYCHHEGLPLMTSNNPNYCPEYTTLKCY